jgi:hypothetical protein
LDNKSWTGLNTARGKLAGCGTQTAALGFGGYAGYGKSIFSNSNCSIIPTAATEEYDGSTWTANPTGLNTARAYLAALAFGGCSTITAATEETGSYKNNYNKLIGGKNGT